MPKTVVLVAGSESYRTADFVRAAALLRVDGRIATDGTASVEGSPGHIEIDPADPAGAAAVIAGRAPGADAVVAVDDRGVVVAARAAALLGLPHNPVEAVAATRDKLAMRRRLDGAGVVQPRYRAAGPGRVVRAATGLGFPVVVKPPGLSASRGVIRADDPAGAARAERRARAILEAAGCDPSGELVVEEYVPGDEVAVEGLVVDGRLQVLAVIDKPDPLEGPYFEETLFTTPSRHGSGVQAASVAAAAAAVRALGLVSGPVHAEVRIPPGPGEPRLIEVAARSIGGLCARALTFGLLGESLEVLVLRAALGIPNPETRPARPAAGVLMLPIPATGTLTRVEGVEHARDVDGIDDVTITIPAGRTVAALPEGDRYLGFVFASGPDPGRVEQSLRRAAQCLTVTIDGEEVRPPLPAPPR